FAAGIGVGAAEAVGVAPRPPGRAGDPFSVVGDGAGAAARRHAGAPRRERGVQGDGASGDVEEGGVNGTAYIAFDLSGLPSERRLRVEREAWAAYDKERAAAMIPDVYARKLQRYRQHRAWREAAAEVN